ncbi:erythromycin esterase family protein [Glycomyces rhizosphaerae]|uniref:Erythromycin esterase family protein n=1 Tax=Glycomyces rhizosphaerae TaxID=2054422 RepID=A0ABV7Q8K2_9ACTN
MTGSGTENRSLADWIDRHAFTIDSLEPDAPLDDLEPLGELVGDARVVAIGESAHHVGEFYRLRHRMLRFLVERCGFTVYAFEAPAGESRAIDAWIRGGPGSVTEVARTSGTQLAHCAEMHATLAWMRRRNRTAARPVRFAGLLPGTGGASFAGELAEVERYAERFDPDALPLLRQAVNLASSYADIASVPRTLTGYAAMSEGERDALTAIMSRLLARMESMGATGDEGGHAHATAALRRAWHLDHFTRDLTGYGLPIGATAMDASIAETVVRLLDGHGPESRIVLGLHNVHIRRTPALGPGPSGRLPAGYHLADALGPDYVAIAATSGGGRTVRGSLDPEQPNGFRFADMPVPVAPDTAVEGAFTGRAATTIADLRAARTAIDEAENYTRILMEDYYTDVPVFDAFDALARVDRTTVTDYLADS